LATSLGKKLNIGLKKFFLQNVHNVLQILIEKILHQLEAKAWNWVTWLVEKSNISKSGL
jgi:hypothetical protein